MPQDPFAVVLSLVGSIALFALVLLLAWVCTRWIGKRYGAARSGERIEVLEQTAFGPNRTLAIVRAGGKVWLLGMTPQQITVVGELDPEAFPEAGEQMDAGGFSGMNGATFAKAMQDAWGKWRPDKEKEKDHQDE